jgi:hypothetical protein
LGSKCAGFVIRSSMRKRTLTGAAGAIRANMEERCGGAVEKEAKISRDASFPSMSRRKMMTKRMMTMTKRRIRQNS